MILRLIPSPAIYGEPYFQQQAEAQAKATLRQVVEMLDAIWFEAPDNLNQLRAYREVIEELRKASQ